MLEKDMSEACSTAIHEAIGRHQTGRTPGTGGFPITFDANGRYEKKETLLKLLGHAAQDRRL
ncbi:MAG: hypothetical protein U5R06_12740 [candidate division KSB1 bacterium]|nr:hypothetical protein [candidate division KSB1 bacterium]